MATYDRLDTASIPADIVVRDREGRIVLLGEIKAPKMLGDRPRPEMRLLDWETRNPSRVPFFLVADVHRIFIVPWQQLAVGPGHPGQVQVIDPPTTLDTRDVLRFYDSRFGEKADSGSIYEFYLKVLIQGWLRDLADHWNLESPPGSKELAEIGLLPRLEGAMVWSGDLDDDPLS